MEEKNSVAKWKEDFTHLSHDHELLQHDHMVLSEKYQSEQQAVANLKVCILYLCVDNKDRIFIKYDICIFIVVYVCSNSSLSHK